MRQEEIPQPVLYRAADIPMTPGSKLSFFTVEQAEEGRHWIAGASESHLTAYLGVVLEPRGTASRLHVVTLVKYNSWGRAGLLQRHSAVSPPGGAPDDAGGRPASPDKGGCNGQGIAPSRHKKRPLRQLSRRPL
jgi:hypothetical protein